MVTTLSFSQFVRLFPAAGTNVPTLVKSEIRYIPRPDRVFIAPTLRTDRLVDRSPALVLVEARAALGKSTLARNLANQTGGLYWDMSEIHAGHGTLWGRLAQTFGTAGLPTVIAELMTGDLLLVLDALDEAELRSGGRGFDAFLEDLKQLVAAPRKRPAVAMFGRPETIEYVSLVLGQDPPFALGRFEIEEFHKPVALEFIDNTLDDEAARRKSWPVHRQHRAMFQRARDLLLNALERNLIADSEQVDDFEIEMPSTDWRNERARGFLGYAPVLESISSYLGGTDPGKTSNFYYHLINDLSETLRHPVGGSGSHWHLLRSVVEDLLTREQRKFLKQAREVLAAAPNADWDRLYNSDEQLARILHRVSHSDLPVELPTGFSVDQEAGYRQLLHTTLPNHPFLGSSSSFVNVVMRDFTYAWAMTRPDHRPMGIVRRAFDDEAYKVSPMLGRFYLSARNTEEPAPSCRAEDTGLIYESLVAEYSTERRPALIISRLADEDEATMVLGGTATSTGTLVRIMSPEDGVRFWRRLSNATVLGGVPVSLGVTGQSFTLGPNVLIHATLFDVAARHVRVSCRPEDEVRIIADDGYVSSSLAHLEPEIDIRGSGFFGVSWDDVRFPWIQYASNAPPTEVDEYVLLGDFVLLCRIMSYLLAVPRPASDIVRRRSEGMIENWFGSSRRMRELIDYLGQCDILFRDDDWYTLDVSKLRTREIQVHALRWRLMTPAVRQLLEDFHRAA